MSEKGKLLAFDAEAALRAATLAVVGLSSTWKYHLQESDRKEIVAEAVAKAWRRRETYKPARASFQTWVGRIARNTLLDFIRRTRPVEDADVQSDDGRAVKAPDTLMMEDEGVETILRAIGGLPDSYQQVITLLSEGKEPREIAEILGCSRNAATIRCCRARRALREKLDEEA